LVEDLIESGDLVRVLPKWQALPHHAFLLYPTRRYQPLRARVFLAFLTERPPHVPEFDAVE
jgi:DNA-binding transcriptional LysR family regulator